MRLPHIFLALLIVVSWGFNFVNIKYALESLSPLTLSCLRFFLTSIPAIFFVKRIPRKSWGLVFAYGLTMFALQFSFLFMSIKAGLTPGLASLLNQVQVFFTIFFATVFMDVKLYKNQLIGALIAFSGIVLVTFHIGENVSFLGFILVMCAATSWGIGNIIAKKIHQVDHMSLVIWGSFMAWPPILLFTLMWEGPAQIYYGLTHLTYRSALSVLYIVVLATIFAFAAWNWLFRRYSAQIVAPFTLLVPIFGFLGSSLVLKEPLEYWKVLAGALIILGLSINLFWKTKLKSPKNPAVNQA